MACLPDVLRLSGNVFLNPLHSWPCALVELLSCGIGPSSYIPQSFKRRHCPVPCLSFHQPRFCHQVLTRRGLHLPETALVPTSVPSASLVLHRSGCDSLVALQQFSLLQAVVPVPGLGAFVVPVSHEAAASFRTAQMRPARNGSHRPQARSSIAS